MANVYMGADVEEFIFDESATYTESSKKEEKEEKKEEVKEEAEVEGATVEEGTEKPAEEPVDEEVEVTAEELNARGVIECVDEPEVACYRIALENEQNYNRIMNAFMEKEYSVLESTGAEMVYEAADVKTFFEAVKKQIAAWWGKIQGVIKQVIGAIANLTDKNLTFVKMYKGKDIKVPEKKAEFKGYDFDKATLPEYGQIAGLVGLTVDTKKITNTLNEKDANEYIEKFKGHFDNMKGQMRAKACGQSGSIAEGDFEKELKVALFGSEDKIDIALKPFDSLLTELENAKIVRAAAKRSYKKAEDAVKTLMKQVKTEEAKLKKADRKDAGMKVAKCMTDAVNACLGIMSKTMSMDTKAMVAKVKQDRAMAMFYVMNQPKKVAAKESVEEIEGNGLNIVII